MKCVVLMVVVASLVAQGQRPSPMTAVQDEKEQSARRLAFMKESVTVYEIYLGKQRENKLSLQPEPILRWNNPVSGHKDGTIFVWTADDGPPRVALGMQVNRGGTWVHEFSSLSPGPLTFDRNKQLWWSLTRPGIEPKAVPGAPGPAKAKLQRLRQMRSIAQDFSASSDFRRRGWWELRLMPRPLYRYGGKPGTRILDGALFAFVQGTNPEVLLLLEARSGETGDQWHYALAPMTYYAVRASLKGRQIWSLRPGMVRQVGVGSERN